MIYKCRPGRVEQFDNRVLGLSAAQIKTATGCDIVFNGALYNGDRSLCCDVKIKGQWIARDQYTYFGYGWSAGQLPTTVHSNDADKFSDFISCVDVTPEANRGRTAFGMTKDGHMVILCVADGREAMTIAQVRAELEGRGCVSNIVLDGGASSQIICPGGEIKSPRNAAHYICVWIDKEEKPVDKKHKICLDPGHGTKEMNQSPDGSYIEHEFALDMANRIRKHLLRNGCEVLLTREDSSTPTLTARAATANTWGADLFVSLHSNAVGSSGWDDKTRGLTVWTYAAGGERDRAAKLLIDQANKLEIQTFGTELYHSKFTVLAKSNMPAYLVEYAFHTAREDVKLLKSNAHRAKLAQATAKAICAWCGTSWVPEAEPSGKIFRVQVGAFAKLENAKALKLELEKKGYKPIIVEG